MAALLLLAVAAPAPAQTAKEPTAGRAAFTIFVRGAQIGREDVDLSRSPGGWTISSTNRLSPPIDLTTNRFELRYGSDWQPIELKLDATLAQAAEGAVSFAELDALDLGSHVVSGLTNDARRLLEAETPDRVRLAGGRSVEVHYELGKPPWIESRLQDFFGSSDGPRILGGSLALTLHLCAPNQRAVQVTSDLAGFWQRHYPTIRRELMRRYPRHSWPEDGRTATVAADLRIAEARTFPAVRSAA